MAPTPEPAGEPSPREAGRPLNPARALDVFEIVRDWLDRGTVPEAPRPGLPRSWVTGVAIRYEGELVGSDVVAAGNAVEADRTLQFAATRAIRRAVSELAGEPDALRAQRLRDRLAASTLSIELAPNPPIPIRAELGVEDLDAWIRPGLEGVAVRLGNDRVARTPGQMLASGRGASGELVGLVSELAADPAVALKPLEELSERGYELSLFRISHVAQISPGGSPLLLHRGGRVAPPIFETGELRGLAAELAEHIMARGWPGVERHGLRGDYDPVSGRFDPSVAPPFAQAFAAEALLRYAGAPGVDDESASGARIAGEATLASLAVVEGGERAPWGDAVSASACLSALARLDGLEVERGDALRTLRDRCVPVVAGGYSVDERDGGFDPMIPAAARGVVARGLLALAEFEPWNRETRLEVADDAIRRIFRETDPAGLLTVMPDLGWAEIELATRTGGPVKSASALVSLRETVLDHQLRRGDLLEIDRDLLGGIVLTGADSPLPTWQSLRPMGLLASMLGDESLTPGTIRSGEVSGQMLRMLEMLRFVRQLSAGEAVTHMYTDPGLSIGGVRASLWDQQMPLTASSLALVTVCETLESMERIRGRRRPAAGGR